MKYLELSYKSEGSNPKIHKIDQDKFRKLLVEFPRPLAERMVELGFGKWIPTNSVGMSLVPIGLTPPEQILFVQLRTYAVKAVHAHSLIANSEDLPKEWNKEIPKDLVKFAYNLEQDIWFKHDPKDSLEPDIDPEEDLVELIETSELSADIEGNLVDELSEDKKEAEPVAEKVKKVEEVKEEAPKKPVKKAPKK